MRFQSWVPISLDLFQSLGKAVRADDVSEELGESIRKYMRKIGFYYHFRAQTRL